MDKLSRTNSREKIITGDTPSDKDAASTQSSEESLEKEERKEGGSRKRAGTWSTAPIKPTMKSAPPADPPLAPPHNPSSSGASSSSATPARSKAQTAIKLDLGKLSLGHAPVSSSNPVVSPRAALSTHRTALSEDSPKHKSSTTTTVASTTTASLPSSSSSSTSTTAVNATPRADMPTTARSKGVPADKLTEKSRSLLTAAMMQGKISPEALGYILVDVQTEGFTKSLDEADQGTPFLRGGLIVNGLLNSSGTPYEPINLIEKFLQPAAEASFNTLEWTKIRDRLINNYSSVAEDVEPIAKGMRPAEMQKSEKLKALMDPVIQPLIDQVCGADQTLEGSKLPDFWKRMLRGVDDAVMLWAKKTNFDSQKELNQIRKQGLIALISTRGVMVVWGKPIQENLQKKGLDSVKFSAYTNSYFSHRVEKFLVDILLSRKDKEGDKFDNQTRNYIKLLSGQKKMKTSARMDNSAESSELKNLKRLRNTKSSMTTVNDPEGSTTTLSPRENERVTSEKTQLQTEQKKEFQRRDYFKKFNKVIDLAKIDPEYYRYFYKYVVQTMSDKAYEQFTKDPVKYCLKHVDKFYAGVLSKERSDKKSRMTQELKAVDPAKIKVLQETKEKSSTSTTATSTTSTSTTSTQPSASFSYLPFPTEDEISDEKDE